MAACDDEFEVIFYPYFPKTVLKFLWLEPQAYLRHYVAPLKHETSGAKVANPEELAFPLQHFYDYMSSNNQILSGFRKDPDKILTLRYGPRSYSKAGENKNAILSCYF